eukprot:286344_1
MSSNMASEDLLQTVVSQLKDKITKECESSLEEHLQEYKQQLNQLEDANKTELNKTYSEYSKKRDTLNNTLSTNVNKVVTDVEKNFNDKISVVKTEMEARLAQIDDELFQQPNTLFQKIVNASKDLTNKRDEFENQRRLWDKDDKRCAAWLGISYDIDDEVKHDEEPANNQRERPQVDDKDFIVIKVDDRTFRTYRGTLTQIKGSLIAKIFGAHSDLIHRDSHGAYCLNCNADVFGEVLELLRMNMKGKIPFNFEVSNRLYDTLKEYEIFDALFPQYNKSGLGLDKIAENKRDFHVVFESWRSTKCENNYIFWNVRHLKNVQFEHDADEIMDEKEEKKEEEKMPAKDVDEQK